MEQGADYFVFVNDRLISRVYPRSRNSYPCRFEFVELKETSPLLRAPFRDSFESFLNAPNRTSTEVLREDDRRYPPIKPELLRLLQLLLHQRSDSSLLEEYEAIDFVSLEENEIWNAVSIGKSSWEGKVKAAFGNYMCNLAFRKWTDTSLSVDDCRSSFIELRHSLEREKLDADFDALRIAIDDLETWKKECQAISSRRRIQSDPKDEALAFFMSIANLPCRDFRRTFFDSETTARLEKFSQSKDLKEGSSLLVVSDFPSRCVEFQSPVTQRPRIIPVQNLVYHFGERK